ncbi:hypothetical protein BG000_003326 [Podila horticola]|nr:hypothetical protein BG000_003326 [Podila horticola]
MTLENGEPSTLPSVSEPTNEPDPTPDHVQNTILGVRYIHMCDLGQELAAWRRLTWELSQVELKLRVNQIEDLANRIKGLTQVVENLDATVAQHEKSISHLLLLLKPSRHIDENIVKVESLEHTVTKLRTEIEGKDAHIEMLEMAAGSPVYHPLVFDGLQTFEDLNQVRTAWRIILFLSGH